MSDSNCLIRDDFVQFLLYDVQDCEELCQWSYFQDHSRETFDLYLDSIKRFSRKSYTQPIEPWMNSRQHLKMGG